MRGTIRLGIMHSLALIDLAALLTRYHRERPLVRLLPSAAAGGSAELTRDVAEGRLDVAFAALPIRTLASEEMMLACPPDHPFAKRRRIDLAELDGERFVDFPAGWGTRLSADRLFLDAGLRREIAVEVADVPNVTELVRAGFGFAFLAPSTVPDTRRLVLRRVRPSPEFTVSLVTADQRTPSAATRALIDLVTATYPEAPRPRRSPR
jgi:DNA-binding transcriptional LysR family regulator